MREFRVSHLWFVALLLIVLLSASIFAQSQAANQADQTKAPDVAPCNESGAKVARYTVLMAGNRAGVQTSWTEPGGSLRYCFEYNDRGRGPRIRTKMLLAPGGLPTAEENTGYDYFKGAVEERFVTTENQASWKSKAESGQTALNGSMFYPSFYGPPEELGLLAKALLNRPSKSLPLLPAGEARIERFGETRIEANGKSETVTHYAISGLGFSPAAVWLDSKSDFFASVSAFLSIIREGWESAVEPLLKAQQQARSARDAALAKRLVHKPAGPLVIQHARLFDSETGQSRPNTTVVISGNRITAVGQHGQLKIPADAETIDAHGQSLLPGLWDMHVHLGDDDGLLNIAAGVTSVRDLANDIDKLLTLRRSFDEGTAIGPRVLMAGFMDGPGPYAGPTKVLVDTPEQIRAAVERYAKLGYVQIKVYSSIRPELVPVIVEEAHKRGMRVSGHVPAFMTAEQAVRAGFDEIQHANFIFLNFLFDKVKDSRTPARFTAVAQNAASIDLNSRPVRSFIELLKQRKTVVDPTVNIFEDIFTARPGSISPGFAEVADRLPVQVRRGTLTGGLPVPDGMDQRYRDSFAAMLRLVKALSDAGIAIVAGTDAMAGFSLHRELELYVQAGIPAPRVLQIATLDAARVMKRDGELGAIAPGKLADLILVDGDPATRIQDIRRVTMVVKDGMRYDAAALDQALGVRPISRGGSAASSAH